MSILQSIIFAAGGTCGYAVLFNIPKRLLPFVALTSAFGWAMFILIPSNSSAVTCFAGAMAVALMGEILSRILKDAATLFIIPGILPMVPGAKMYYMTRALLAQDYSDAAVWAMEVIFSAGGIAIGILLIYSFTKVLLHYKKERQKKKITDEEEIIS